MLIWSSEGGPPGWALLAAPALLGPSRPPVPPPTPGASVPSTPPCLRGPSGSPELEVRGCGSGGWESLGAQCGLVQGGCSGGRFQAGRLAGGDDSFTLHFSSELSSAPGAGMGGLGKLRHVQGGPESMSLPSSS